jgi:hypothetical protein
VDPYPRGPDWMPITPKTASLFHADAQPDAREGQAGRSWGGGEVRSTAEAGQSRVLKVLQNR